MPTFPADPAAPFPARDGEMAKLIRAFDWSGTRLGPLVDWPASLKTVINLILHARVPMAVLWGEDGVLIYNDGYGVIAGTRHPGLLGSKVRESWPETADFNDHVLKVVLAGEALSYRDQHMVLYRNGTAEDAWFNLDYSPIIADGVEPAGVLATVIETTARVLTEQRLRIAQEAGGVGSFEWYPDTGQLEVSDEFRRIWGFAPDTVVTGQLLVDLVEPMDRAHTGAAKVGQPNPLEYSEYRIRRASDGETRWVARRGEVVATDAQGRPRFVGVSIDITERRNAEEAVLASEARWRGLFEQMQEGFMIGEMVRDPHGAAIDFLFLEVNPAFQIHTGRSWRAAVGQPLQEIMPGAGDLLIPLFAKVATTGEAAQFEIQIPALDDRWFEVRARSTGGDHVAVVFIDITARKATEAALLESEARFRSLAQSVPNHVWATGPDGSLDWFNDKVFQFSGLPIDALKGEGWIDLIHPDDREASVARWRASLAEGTPYQTEFRLRRQDGVHRWHIARALPIRGKDGVIRRWIGTNTDIQDQRAATEALAKLAETLEERVVERTAELTAAHDALRQSQKMEAVGQLTGGIAHDFNNLLQGVVGSLDVVQKRIAQGRVEDVQRFLNGALASANRATTLTHRLLAFSRRQPLDPKPVKANPLLASMEELLRRTIGETIQLEFVLAGGLWQTLCDANQLESAVLNLVINARDAMPEGGKLTLETANARLDDAYAARARDVKPGQYVCVAVTDTGAGMPPDVIERAFDPFFTTKPIGKGTGLGLSMIYGFTRQSEGYCKIYSEVGQGTTVKLYLPRHREEAAEQESSDDIERVTADSQSETVLVVEDEPIVRSLVVEVLEELGYRVLEAGDGVAGLQVLHSPERVDLLITDIGLPGLNGRQVADGGRVRRPDLKVLFMTGYAENATLANGFLEPGMAMITKPFPMDTLMARIRTMLQPAA